MNRYEAIKALLEKWTHPYLSKLYVSGMEVQVTVGRDGGHRVGEYRGHKANVFTDGITTWFPIRIPKFADTDNPEDNSTKEMSWDICAHAEAIGLTGWHYIDKRSRHFGFDFDALVGHSVRHTKKMSDAELSDIKDAACKIPWVTVMKSTSGKGIHLYVHLLNTEPTATHTEHAALGRAILAQMSAFSGFDFDAKVDACGGNMWVWARKMKGTDGLTLIKEGELLVSVPNNWKNHVKVIRGIRKRTLPLFINEGQKDLEQVFEELSGQHPRIRLDEEHKRLIQSLESLGWWDADHHMLVTHTLHLKKLHSELNFRGVFETISEGTDLATQNCFCYPIKRGGWVIRRYTPGVAEAETWDQDGRGYTKCYYNCDPDFSVISRLMGGAEVEAGGYVFQEAEVAAQVIQKLGGNAEIPIGLSTRAARLKTHKDGRRLVLEIDHTTRDNPKGMEGWVVEKGKWKRIYNIAIPASQTQADLEIGIYDDVVRHCVTELGSDADWFIKVDNRWNHEPKDNVKLALISLGRKRIETDALLGASIMKPWTLVSRPFSDEYPGDRLWNKKAAQLRYPLTEDVGDFLHWTTILKHCGSGLNDALSINGWAQANEVKTGYEYLLLWLASLIQYPYDPLPYLFLYSNAQNCGKSTFHEVLDLLISDGIVLANTALKSKGDFNAELEGKVVCIVEELNLKRDREAYDRIKNWVTAPTISIHPKNFTPYMLPNTTHWIHTANDSDACPIFPGDTRITMLVVPALSEGSLIPKPELRVKLQKEAHFFLNYLRRLELPPSGDRLRVPVIETAEKEKVASSNRTPLEEFLAEHAHQVSGERMSFAEFYSKFFNWLDPMEQGNWSKIKVSKQMPPEFPVGHSGGAAYIGNISWERKKGDKPRLILNGKNLVSSGN